MSKELDSGSSTGPATFRPWLKIGVVIAVTIFMLFGIATLDSGESDGNEAFLPDGSELVEAQNRLTESFPQNSGLVSIQVIGRGTAALEPAAVEGFINFIDAAADDAEVAPYLSSTGAVASYAHSYRSLTRMLQPSPSASPEEVLELGLETEATATLAQNLNDLLARDEFGSIIGGIGIVTLRTEEGQEKLVNEAQLRIEDLTEEAEISDLSVRSLSAAKQTKESEDAQASSTVLLLALAMLVILVLLAIFYRSFSDVVISLVGLFVTIIWAFGFQQWLGPGGLGWVGPTSALIIMVPVILIGLCVDYALQVTGRYRQELAQGPGKGNPKAAIIRGVRHSILPLFLAGGTTAISLFTNLTSSIGANRDLGVIAGLGVLSGLVVMTSFAPSIRNLLDMRRARKSKTLKTRTLADSIPGLNSLFSLTTRLSVNKPASVLGVVMVITIVAIWGASNISTTFSTTEFAPTGAETTEDINYLNENLGGQTETTTILIEADLNEDRTLRNLIDLENDLADPARRPEGLTGPVTLSLGILVTDLINDSGEPGDRYSPELVQMTQSLGGTIAIPPEDLDQTLETIRAADSEAFDQVAVIDPDKPDRTILQVQALTGDIDRTRILIGSIEGLWRGPADQITTVAGEVLTVEVVDEMLDSQTQSVLITIAAAGLILLLFFGVTEFRPMLGLLAILPVAFVLLWVLGTMTLLGISYNIVTALITALSIGIGVDYTIHFIHRFLEETESGAGVKEAIAATKKSVGGALAGSGVTTVLGFLVLVFSPISGMRQFGIVIAITILFSFLATIFVLPSLLALWHSYHRWRITNPNPFHEEIPAAAATQPSVAKAHH